MERAPGTPWLNCAKTAPARTAIEKLQAPAAKGMLRVIPAGTPAVQEARVLEFSPVGRYALAFAFNDGHSTGIYTYDFLRSTGQKVEG
jgi:DUF971 family protein